MKKFLASLFGIASVTASAAGMQTITVDEQHIQMGLAEGQVGEYYLRFNGSRIKHSTRSMGEPCTRGRT
jgi:hypothetical protein